MQLKKILTTISVFVGGCSLTFFIDGRGFVYGFGKQAVFLGVLSFCAASIYGVCAMRGVLQKIPSLHTAAVAYIAWTLFSIAFGLHSLQVTSIWFAIVLGALISFFIGFLSVFEEHSAHGYERVTAFIAFEWFLVLLFAPASFLVLGALATIATIISAMIFDLHRVERDTSRAIFGLVFLGMLIFATFIFGFRWAL